MKFISSIFICIVLASCGVTYHEYNDQGFGGGFGVSKKSTSSVSPNTFQNENSKSAAFTFQGPSEILDTIVIKKSIGTISTDKFNENVPQNQTKHLNKTKLLSVLNSPASLIRKVKKQYSENIKETNSNWSIARVVLLTLGLILLIASIFILAIGGGSGNYYAVALFGALLLLLSVILILVASWKAMKAGYHRLGFWGKLGFWLMLAGTFTLGITTLVGIPMWIYGIITGE